MWSAENISGQCPFPRQTWPDGARIAAERGAGFLFRLSPGLSMGPGLEQVLEEIDLQILAMGPVCSARLRAKLQALSFLQKQPLLS